MKIIILLFSFFCLCMCSFPAAAQQSGATQYVNDPTGLIVPDISHGLARDLKNFEKKSNIRIILTAIEPKELGLMNTQQFACMLHAQKREAATDMEVIELLLIKGRGAALCTSTKMLSVLMADEFNSDQMKPIEERARASDLTTAAAEGVTELITLLRSGPRKKAPDFNPKLYYSSHPRRSYTPGVFLFRSASKY